MDSSPQQSKNFPQEWLEAEGELGSLAIEYRLTNDCEIDPNFEIVEYQNINVTREEILGAIAAFIKRSTLEDVPEKAIASASLEVFGQETIPDRTLEKSEYDALLAAIDRLGPWPVVRSMPIGRDDYKCTFDHDGNLKKVEKLASDGEGYTELEGKLSEQGPWRFRWRVED